MAFTYYANLSAEDLRRSVCPLMNSELIVGVRLFFLACLRGEWNLEVEERTLRS
jgi:hypothetical protein